MKNKSFLALLFTLALFLSGYAVMEAQTILPNFEWAIAKRITVTLNGITVQRGDVLLADGDLTLSDNLILTAQPVITVTTFFTPTGRYQPVTATAARGVTMTVGAEGMVVTITNIGTNTITSTDTAPLIMAGNLALGQYDNLTLRSDGTRWIEMGRSNN